MLITTAALLASLAMMGITSSAMATPTGEFAQFAQCPANAPEVFQCILANTTSGEFVIGTTTVPINKTITLQGAIAENEAGESRFVGALNGETLSKTALNVPGGLLGIVAPEGWPAWLQAIFNNFINEGLTGVTATAELSNGASAIEIHFGRYLFGVGTALKLPVKIKLGNAFLGNECYIGSSSHPVTLNLTTGATEPPLPNHSIHGSPGTLVSNEAGSLLTFTNNSLVDNAYSAPEVNGCGGIFSFLVNPVVNLKIGLPAAAGKNTAILDGKLEVAGARAVRESE